MNKYRKLIVNITKGLTIMAIIVGMTVSAFPAFAKSNGNGKAKGHDNSPSEVSVKAKSNVNTNTDATTPATVSTTTLTSCPTSAFGHLIAPGWIKHNGVTVIPEGCSLPPGIAKKLGLSSGGGTGDTTAPVISNLAVSNIASTSAHVAWTTNESANGKVFYGTTTPLDTAVASMVTASGTTDHGADLSGLTASTTYYVVVKSTDGSGNTATSSQFSFTTSSVADTAAPVVSSVTVFNLTQTSADIIWLTNESANSKVYYSTSSPVVATSTTSSVASATMETSHHLVLTGLTAGTMYHFLVASADASSNVGFSTEGSFTTLSVPDTTAPVISALASSAVATSSAHIAWMTDESANGKVFYSTTSPVNTGTASMMTASGTTTHTADLTGLTASTTYYYVVTSADGSSNTATSTEHSFTTLALPDTSNPVISSVVASSTSATSEKITWNTDELATSVIWYSTTTPVVIGSPSTMTGTTSLSTSHSVDLTGLTASTTYYYSVLSADASANLTTQSGGSFVTP